VCMDNGFARNVKPPKSYYGIIFPEETWDFSNSVYGVGLSLTNPEGHA
jgi:hypothetical protein